jgi:hypothetical protein
VEHADKKIQNYLYEIWDSHGSEVVNVGLKFRPEDPGRWDGGIKMDLKKTGFEGVQWIQLAQDKVQWRALVNTVMNFRVS